MEWDRKGAPAQVVESNVSLHHICVPKEKLLEGAFSEATMAWT